MKDKGYSKIIWSLTGWIPDTILVPKCKEEVLKRKLMYISSGFGLAAAETVFFVGYTIFSYP